MIRNVGIMGESFSGAKKRVYFDRMPGWQCDQIRIRTADSSIFIAENDFLEVIRVLFASDEPYQPKHGTEGKQ